MSILPAEFKEKGQECHRDNQRKTDWSVGDDVFRIVGSKNITVLPITA
ncbi:MAG: hypothetical protein ACOX3R_00025 [Desulfitobacteriia bacterium]